jgi:hypothetical protein
MSKKCELCSLQNNTRKLLAKALENHSAHQIVFYGIDCETMCGVDDNTCMYDFASLDCVKHLIGDK